jgi:hypothetical protein
LLAARLRRDLEDDFQSDGGAERKACDAIQLSGWVLVFSEDVLQQLRRAVSNFRLIANIFRSLRRHYEPNDPRRFVEKS